MILIVAIYIFVYLFGMIHVYGASVLKQLHEGIVALGVSVSFCGHEKVSHVDIHNVVVPSGSYHVKKHNDMLS